MPWLFYYCMMSIARLRSLALEATKLLKLVCSLIFRFHWHISLGHPASHLLWHRVCLCCPNKIAKAPGWRFAAAAQIKNCQFPVDTPNRVSRNCSRTWKLLSFWYSADLNNKLYLTAGLNFKLQVFKVMGKMTSQCDHQNDSMHCCSYNLSVFNLHFKCIIFELVFSVFHFARTCFFSDQQLLGNKQSYKI